MTETRPGYAAGAEEKPKAIRRDKEGRVFCPTCGKYQGFLDCHRGRTMMFTTHWVEWEPRFYCPECDTLMAFAASDELLESLTERVLRRMEG